MAEIPADAWPAGDRIEWDDDTTRTHHDFLNETTRPYTDEENAAADERTAAQVAEANRDTLIAAARDALAVNRTFLALQAPTNAQTLAQVKALTRQMNAIVRLTINDTREVD